MLARPRRAAGRPDRPDRARLGRLGGLPDRAARARSGCAATWRSTSSRRGRPWPAGSPSPPARAAPVATVVPGRARDAVARARRCCAARARSSAACAPTTSTPTRSATPTWRCSRTVLRRAGPRARLLDDLPRVPAARGRPACCAAATRACPLTVPTHLLFGVRDVAIGRALPRARSRPRPRDSLTRRARRGLRALHRRGASRPGGRAGAGVSRRLSAIAGAGAARPARAYLAGTGKSVACRVPAQAPEARPRASRRDCGESSGQSAS